MADELSPPGTAPPTPIPPPTPPRPRAAANTTQWLLIVAIIGSLLVILGVVALMLLRPGPAAPSSTRIAAAPRRAPVAPPPETRPPAPAVQPAPAQAAEPPEILPDSSQRELAADDVQGLSLEQLRLARNEIYARHGRIFDDPALRDYFSRYSWYQPVAYDVALSPVEEANVRLLQEAESW